MIVSSGNFVVYKQRTGVWYYICIGFERWGRKAIRVERQKNWSMYV